MSNPTNPQPPGHHNETSNVVHIGLQVSTQVLQEAFELGGLRRGLGTSYETEDGRRFTLSFRLVESDEEWEQLRRGQHADLHGLGPIAPAALVLADLLKHEATGLVQGLTDQAPEA